MPLRESKSKCEFAKDNLTKENIDNLFKSVLAYFDIDILLDVSADASKDGLGAVVLQNNKPVVYASRSLTSVESNIMQ